MLKVFLSMAKTGSTSKATSQKKASTSSNKNATLVSIVMGSDSDWPVMKAAADFLQEIGIGYEATIVSAHRTPERMVEFAKTAQGRGIRVIIAGAGGAAHLPGMLASLTALPVIGVPVKSSNSMDGWDSVLSILQMPNGVPVATVALNAAKNAGILSAQIIGSADKALFEKLSLYKDNMRKEVLAKASNMKKNGVPNSFD